MEIHHKKNAELQVTKAESHGPENTVYKGVTISGLENLEQYGLEQSDITDLLDRLPPHLFQFVPLVDIHFFANSLFSIKRGDEVTYVWDHEMLPTDQMIARKRGSTAYLEDSDGYKDGRRSISIYNVHNWDERHDSQFDRDTVLFTLTHEIGHAIYASIAWQDWRNQETLKKWKNPPLNGRNLSKFRPILLNTWRKLPESQLKRFQDYKLIVLEEIHSSNFSGWSAEDQLWEEDFTITMEHFLYWQDLNELDPDRARKLQALFSLITSYMDEVSDDE